MTVREFGVALSKFLMTKKAQSILRARGLDEWGAGGCWVLAAALQALLGKRAAPLYYVGSSHGVEHIVAKIGGVYVDDDGAQTGADLFSKMRLQRYGPFIATFGKKAKAQAYENGTYYADDMVDELTALLRKRFGVAQKAD